MTEPKFDYQGAAREKIEELQNGVDYWMDVKALTCADVSETTGVKHDRLVRFVNREGGLDTQDYIALALWLESEMGEP
jgi:hypothetical protein